MFDTNLHLVALISVGIVVARASIGDFSIKHEDPLLSAGHFEGDIRGVNPRHVNRSVRTLSLWPGGIVPFEVIEDIDRATMNALHRAMKEITQNTCIKFRPSRRNDRHFVIFTAGGDGAKGCSTFVGRKGGSQEVILGPGCAGKGVILHELMHVLGFWHEHSRVDRDNFIQLHYDKMKRGSRNHFQKYTIGEKHHGGEPYDFDSIMHLPKNAFAKKANDATIKPKRGRKTFGQRNKLSRGDIRKISQEYCSAWES